MENVYMITNVKEINNNDNNNNNNNKQKLTYVTCFRDNIIT